MFENLLNDPVLIIEAIIVAVIIVLQLIVFARNNTTIHRLRTLYPKPGRLTLTEAELVDEGDTPVADGPSVMVIREDTGYPRTFQEIVRYTNTYLRRNEGNPTYNRLEEIAVAQDESVEDAIEASYTLPLYIGLMSTFLGVIIGLFKIAQIGVNDQAIQSFIGGVLIGMIGSFCGLGLTVLSNQRLKTARRERDRRRYLYLAFLRDNVLPARAALARTADAGANALRSTLKAFHSSFADYQAYVNQSLTHSLKLFEDIKGVAKRIRAVEGGVASMGEALENSDEVIERQVRYIENFTQRTEAMSGVVAGHFEEMNKRLTATVDQTVDRLEKNVDTAYTRMNTYLQSLEGEQAKALVDDMESKMGSMRFELAELQQKNLAVNERMLSRLNAEDQSSQRLTAQLESVNAQLKQVREQQEEIQGSFINSGGLKLFAYTGAAFFIAALAGGIAYVALQLL